MNPNECNEDFWYAFMATDVMSDTKDDISTYSGGGPLDRQINHQVRREPAPNAYALRALEEECALLEQHCLEQGRTELSGSAWEALEWYRVGADSAQRVRRALDEGWLVLERV